MPTRLELQHLAGAWSVADLDPELMIATPDGACGSGRVAQFAERRMTRITSLIGEKRYQLRRRGAVRKRSGEMVCGYWAQEVPEFVPMSSTALMAPPLIGLKEPLRWCRFRVSDVVAYLGVFHPPWQGVSDGPWRSPRQVWSSGRWSGRGGGALRAPSGPSAPLRASAGHRGRALGGVRWSGSGHRSPHAVEPCSLGPR